MIKLVSQLFLLLMAPHFAHCGPRNWLVNNNFLSWAIELEDYKENCIQQAKDFKLAYKACLKLKGYKKSEASAGMTLEADLESTHVTRVLLGAIAETCCVIYACADVLPLPTGLQEGSDVLRCAELEYRNETQKALENTLITEEEQGLVDYIVNFNFLTQCVKTAKIPQNDAELEMKKCAAHLEPESDTEDIVTSSARALYVSCCAINLCNHNQAAAPSQLAKIKQLCPQNEPLNVNSLKLDVAIELLTKQEQDMVLKVQEQEYYNDCFDQLVEMEDEKPKLTACYNSYGYDEQIIEGYILSASIAHFMFGYLIKMCCFTKACSVSDPPKSLINGTLKSCPKTKEEADSLKGAYMEFVEHDFWETPDALVTSSQVVFFSTCMKLHGSMSRAQKAKKVWLEAKEYSEEKMIEDIKSLDVVKIKVANIMDKCSLLELCSGLTAPTPMYLMEYKALDCKNMDPHTAEVHVKKQLEPVKDTKVLAMYKQAQNYMKTCSNKLGTQKWTSKEAECFKQKGYSETERMDDMSSGLATRIKKGVIIGTCCMVEICSKVDAPFPENALASYKRYCPALRTARQINQMIEDQIAQSFMDPGLIFYMGLTKLNKHCEKTFGKELIGHEEKFEECKIARGIPSEEIDINYPEWRAFYISSLCCVVDVCPGAQITPELGFSGNICPKYMTMNEMHNALEERPETARIESAEERFQNLYDVISDCNDTLKKDSLNNRAKKCLLNYDYSEEGFMADMQSGKPLCVGTGSVVVICCIAEICKPEWDNKFGETGDQKCKELSTVKKVKAMVKEIGNSIEGWTPEMAEAECNTEITKAVKNDPKAEPTESPNSRRKRQSQGSDGSALQVFLDHAGKCKSKSTELIDKIGENCAGANKLTKSVLATDIPKDEVIVETVRESENPDENKDGDNGKQDTEGDGGSHGTGPSGRGPGDEGLITTTQGAERGARLLNLGLYGGTFIMSVWRL